MTSILAGTCALFESDAKKVVAFSTMSQLGVMVYSIGLGLVLFSLFHLFIHAAFKALLFFVCWGVNSQHDRLSGFSGLRGLAKVLSFHGFCFGWFFV